MDYEKKYLQDISKVRYWKKDDDWFETFRELAIVVTLPFLSIIFVSLFLKNISITIKSFDLIKLLAIALPVIIIIFFFKQEKRNEFL